MMRSGSEALVRVTRWGAARPFASDVLFAALIGALTILGFLSAEPQGSERAPDMIGVLLIATMTAGLVERRRRPIPSLLVVIAATVVFWVADYATNFDAFSLLAIYAATAHGGPDRARVWSVVGAVVAGLTVIALAGVLSPGEDLPAAAVLGIAAIHLTAAVAGEIVYERRQRVDALQLRATRAEAERESLAREAVLEERARIARDLHDIVAHGVSVMVVQAAAAQRVVESQPKQAAQALDDIQVTGRQALSDMRRMLGLLRDVERGIDLAPQPSISDVDEIVERCNDAGVRTELIVEGAPPADSAAGAEMTSYRIVQEALTNVIKHAGRPVKAVVKITHQTDSIRVEVTDDGSGATTADVEQTTGHGLVGMRERVELYGGRFRAGPRPGGGFRISATIPIDAMKVAS